MALEERDLTAYPADELTSFQEQEEELPRSPEVDYGLNWNERKQKRLARHLTTRITQYLNATEQRRENVRKWRRDWDLYPSDEHPEPWPNAANIPGADTRRACNAHHARLNQQILMLDPPFAAVAMEDEAVQVVPQIEEALPAFLEEAEWQVEGNRLHQELPAVGNAFLSVTYDVERAWKPYYEADYQEEMARALVMAGQMPHEAALGALAKDAQGRVKRKLAFKEEIVYQGVRLRVINWEDGLILPVTARSADEAFAVGERVRMLGEELARGAKEGRYLREGVEYLLKMPPDALDEDSDEALQVQGIDANEYSEGGEYYTEDGYHEASLYHQYTCYEMCVKLDTEGDGNLKWCWVMVHPATETLLRLQYLPWAHGQCHYHHFPYFERVNQLWGQGVAELIACHQDARQSALNQQIDYADLAIRIATTLLLDDKAGQGIVDTFDLVLGQANYVEDINGVKQLILPNLPLAHAQLPDLLKNEIDLVTGATDPMMGKTAEGNPTLGEVQIAVGSGNVQFENAAAAVARRWKRVWDQVRWLIAEHGEGEEIKYRKAAMPGARIQLDEQTGGIVQQPPVPEFGTITSQILRAKVDLVPAGLQHMSDIQTRIQQAQVTWREVTTNQLIAPLLAANPRLLLMAFDYYLQQLRVPIRRQMIQEMEQTIFQMMAQAATAQQAADAQAAGGVDAQIAGTEAAIQAQMANEGMLQGTTSAVPTNGAAPPMAVAA